MPVYDPPHCQGYEDGEIPNGFEIPCGRGRDGLEFAFHVIFAVYFLPPIIMYWRFLQMHCLELLSKTLMESIEINSTHCFQYFGTM